MTKLIENTLADYGYNLVVLPKEDIAPLLLLYKNRGDVSSSGNNIFELFGIADSPPPIVSKNNAILDLKGNATIGMEGKSGMKFLNGLLQKLKMGKVSGNFEASKVNTIHINYENVLEDNVSLLELDNYISGSEPNVEGFNTFKKKLKDSDLYVINSVLKSNSFSISAQNDSGQAVDLETTIKGILEANVNLKRSKKNEILLEHKNAAPLVFAFKAQRIIYDQKWWQFFKKGEAKFRIKDEHGVILKDESNFPTQSLQEKNELLNI